MSHGRGIDPDHPPPAGSPAARLTFARSALVVRLVAPIVPLRLRDEWRAEWTAELWYRIDALDRAGLLERRARSAIMARSLGALPHALSLRRMEWRLDMLLHDLRYAARMHLKRPAFALLVIAILAAGIGATSAMFSIVNGIVLKPLPYDGSASLVYAYGKSRRGNYAAISAADFLDYQSSNRVFSSLAAQSIFGTSVISGGGDPERVGSPMVSANFFATLGVRPLLGRAFRPSEEDGEQRVVILSHGFWRRRFGGDPGVVGRKIILDGEPNTIVGVMPPVLERTFTNEIWRPLGLHSPELASNRQSHILNAIGRLRSGTTLETARADVDRIATQLGAAYPQSRGWGLNLQPYRDVVIRGADTPLIVLLGAVGMVLLIACANVASLMLTRATARESEIAVRAALGASRSALVRQFFAESMILGAAAGATGLVLAFVLVRVVRITAGGMLPRVAEVSVDATAIAFTVAITLLTILIFGLAPALHAAGRNLGAAMHSMGRSSGSRRSLRVRHLLVVGQVALSLVLLVGAGLLLRSLAMVRNVDPGFDPRSMLTASIPLPATEYPDRAAAERFWTELLERVRVLPGVTAAAGTGLLPLRGFGDALYYVEGHPPASKGDLRDAVISVVTDDYFRTMRTPILAGRPLGAEDHRSGDVGSAVDGGVHESGAKEGASQGTVVISRAMAQKLFPGESPLGHRLVVGDFTAEIVGVAGDVHAFGREVDARDMMYFPEHQRRSYFGMNLVVRTAGDPTMLVPAIREILGQLDPDVPMANIATMEEILHDSVASSWFRTRLLGAFAIAALLLAVTGLYGVLAYAVRQRAREIGIRIALGAPAAVILRSIVARGMLLVSIGLAIGVAGALGTARLMAGMLFKVQSTDPLVFASVIVAIIVAGFLASLLPALRALAIDPSTAIKA